MSVVKYNKGRKHINKGKNAIPKGQNTETKYNNKLVGPKQTKTVGQNKLE